MENFIKNYKVITYWSDEDGLFLAEVPELPGCMADGKTEQQAIDNARVIIDEWIETAMLLGREIPKPGMAESKSPPDREINIPQNAHDEILRLAKQHDLERVILFGSRARGTNSPRSDIDIAVQGGDFRGFYYDIEEKARTLLMFDIVDLDRKISTELSADIQRDGIVIYEKV